MWYYKYDALGRRISKECPQQHLRIEYLWDGDQLTYTQTFKNGKLDSQRHSVFNGWQLLAQQDSYQQLKQTIDGNFIEWKQETGYAICQPNGQVLALLNPKGRTLWRKEKQTLWGLCFANEYKQPNPLDPQVLFAGQWVDEESGLVYNRFRYYDPNTACYLNSDPIGLEGGSTPYFYVQNPLQFIDPFGLANCKLSSADKSKLGAAPVDMAKPHYHHIVREKAPKNWKPENQKYITDAQEVLKKYGIDKNKDLRNFVWAENGAGVHTVKKAKEVYDKLMYSEKLNLGKAGIEKALKELGNMFNTMR